jgi:hypothetical protein
MFIKMWLPNYRAVDRYFTFGVNLTQRFYCHNLINTKHQPPLFSTFN